MFRRRLPCPAVIRHIGPGRAGLRLDVQNRLRRGGDRRGRRVLFAAAQPEQIQRIGRQPRQSDGKADVQAGRSVGKDDLGMAGGTRTAIRPLSTFSIRAAWPLTVAVKPSS